MQQTLLTVSELYLLWEDERTQSHRPPDMALLASLEALAQTQGVHLEDVATLLARARVPWNPDLHPRGRDGKFIETWGWVNIPWSWKDALPVMVRGQVVSIKPDPRQPGNPDITVALLDPTTGKASKVTQVVKPRSVEEAPQPKAYLPSAQADVYEAARRAEVPAAPGEEREALPLTDAERQARQRAMAKDGVDLSDGVDEDEAKTMKKSLSGSSDDGAYEWFPEGITTRTHHRRTREDPANDRPGFDEVNIFGQVAPTDYDTEDNFYYGDFRRRLLRREGEDEWVVHNELLDFPPRMQGQGVGTEFTQHYEDYWIAHGIKRMDIHAGMAVGGYAWARAGYGWNPDAENTIGLNRRAAQATLDNIARVTEADRPDVAAQAREMRDKFVGDDPTKWPTPFEISELGRRPDDVTWPGKEMMIWNPETSTRMDWYGTKFLPSMVPEAPGEEVEALPLADIERQARRQAYAKDGVDLSDGITAAEAEKIAVALSGETKISKRSNDVEWDTRPVVPQMWVDDPEKTLRKLSLKSDFKYTDAISLNERNLGNADRALRQDPLTGEWIVSNEWLTIDGVFQGQGIGTEYTQQWEDYWIAHGVRKMQTHAALDVGGYAWARAGYTWPEDEDTYFDESQETASEWLDYIIWNTEDPDDPAIEQAKKMLAQVKSAISNKGLPTPFEISELGREEGDTEWVGKDALMGSDWYGEKILPTMPGVSEGEPLRRVSLTELPSVLPEVTGRRVANNEANGIDRANAFWAQASADQNSYAFETMRDRTWARIGHANPSSSPTTQLTIDSALGLMETNPKIQTAQRNYGDVPVLAFESLPANALGIYLGDIIVVSDPAEPVVRDSLQTVGPKFNIDTSMYGTLRHEYGHHVYSMLPQVDRARWQTAFDAWGGELDPDGVNDLIRRVTTLDSPPPPDEVDRGLSVYGRSNVKEAFAETFALVTHPDFDPEKVDDRIAPLVDLVEEFITQQTAGVPPAPLEDEVLPMADVERAARRKAMAADGVDLSDGINVEESITIGKTLTGKMTVDDDPYEWNTRTSSREMGEVISRMTTNTDIYQWGLSPKRIGGMDRTLRQDDDGTWVVDNNMFMLDPAYQGQGVGTELFQYFEDYWIAHGVDRMRVHATFTVGGFAWARMGYDWSDESFYREFNRQTATKMLTKVIADPESEPSTKRNAQLMMDKFESIDDVEEWPTPFDISELGRRDGMEDWPGKRAMMGTSWDGVKHLPKMDEAEPAPMLDVERQMAADGVDLADGISDDDAATMQQALGGTSVDGQSNWRVDNVRVHALPERIYNGVTYPPSETADIRGTIETAEGPGSFVWVLSRTQGGEWVPKNEDLVLPEGMRDQGLSKEIGDHFEDYWISHGIRTAKARSSLDGGFPWAMSDYGWDPDPKHFNWNLNNARRTLERIAEATEADRPDVAAQARAMHARIGDDVTQWPTPFEILELGRRPGDVTWPGMDAAFWHGGPPDEQMDWHGAKALSPPLVEPAEILPMLDIERTVRQQAMATDDVNVTDGIDDAEIDAMKQGMSGPIGDGFSLRFDEGFHATVPPNNAVRSDIIWFKGVVLDDRGIVSGKINRQLTQDKYSRAWTVHNSSFSMAAELQGQGIGTETTQRLEDYWIAHGISDVRVTAGDLVGGYAWARAGFDWDPDQFRPNKEYAEKTLAFISGNEAWPQEVRDRAKEMWQQVRDSVETAGMPTPYEISELGREFSHPDIDGREMWAGKAAMMAQGRFRNLWTGAKTLPPMAPAEPVPEVLPMIDVEREIRQRSMANDGVDLLDGVDDAEAQKVMEALSGETVIPGTDAFGEPEQRTFTWKFSETETHPFSDGVYTMFRGWITGPDGEGVGTVTRRIMHPAGEDPYISNAVVYIAPGFTGQGIGTELTQHIEDYWIAHDVHDVRVQAGETIGGYAWARAGFGWDPDYFKTNQTSARWMLREVLDEARGDKDVISRAKAMSARVRAATNVDEMPTPFEISELGRKDGDTTWPGKRVMMGSQWSGKKTLPKMVPQRPLPVVDMNDLDLVPPAPSTESAPAIYFDVEPDFVDPAPPTPPLPATRFQQVDLRTELAGAMIEPIRRRMAKRANDPVPDETYNWRAWKPVFDTPIEEREWDWGRPFASAAMDIWGRGNPGEYSPFGTINIDRDPPPPEGKEAIDRILDVIEANPKIRAAEDRYGTVPIVGVETLPYEALGVYMTDIIAVNPSAAQGFEPKPLRLAENVDLSLNGTLRHEYGHHVYSMLSSEDQDRWTEVHRAWGGDLGSPDAVNAEIDRLNRESPDGADPYEYTYGLSFYGRNNKLEAFGETFALVTHPDYDPAKVDPRIKPMTDLMEEFIGPSQDADRAALADAGVPEVEPIYQSSLTNPDTPRTRGVSAQEFAQLAAQGKQRLDTLMDNESSPDALNDDAGWQRIKDSAWESLQTEWGGRTFDAHTGAVVADDDPRYALTIKQPGMETVQVPINSDRQTFDAAMDQARAKFADAEDGPLWMENAHLGVFRNEDIGQYEIDPVLLVDTHEEVESIGAYTNATGGAYKFQDGNGYWPPYIAQGDPSGTTEEGPAGVGEVARPSQGAEANVGVESVPA